LVYWGKIFFWVRPYTQPDKHRETGNITRVMTEILDKQKENTTQLIDDTTSIFYQPVLLFCFLIRGKPNSPFLQAFMATILTVCNVQCLQLVDICILRNISWCCMWLVHWFFNSTMTAEAGVPWDDIVMYGELLKTEE
jgi:hypothetical protein